MHLLRSFFEPPTGLIDKDIFANSEPKIKAPDELRRSGNLL